ncbi:WYL domain-containing protein [bacterium]|nr:WYL domain-containing protein [bacterium]
MSDKEQQFQRLMRLVGELVGSRGKTVAELGGLDNSSRRQIQRDLLKLRECGLPLRDSESHERPPRYWLENLRVAGAQLDLEETLAVTLATLLAGPKDLGQLARRGWNKLHYAVLNGQELRAKSDLPLKVSTQTSWDLPGDLLKALSTALLDARRVRLFYHSFKDPEPRWRVIEPAQLFFQDRWYLCARDPQEGLHKNFRLERIREFELLKETFKRPSPPANPHFHKWDLVGAEPVAIRCRVDSSVARWLRENPVHPTQNVEGGEFTLSVRDTESFLIWALGLSHCEVLEPPGLRERMRSRLQEMLQRMS